MSKSKRQKKYSFTTTQKKGLEWKKSLADKVKQYVHEYDRCIIFKFVNPRTDLIQAVRRRFRRSRFIMGKNKILQIGLGRTEEEEIDTNLHKIANKLAGQRGLLFTNEKLEDILEYFNTHRVKVHSRPGGKAPSTVNLEPGLLDTFSHNQEPYLRKLGLVTRLKVVGAGTGVPELLVPFQVSKKGKRLTPNQANILRLLGYKESEFQVRLFTMWERETQQLKSFKLNEEGEMVVNEKKPEKVIKRKKEDMEDDEDEDENEEEDNSEDEMTSDDDVESEGDDQPDFMDF